MPLDANTPQERLAFILADTAASVLLTQHNLLATLPNHTALTWCLDSAWHQIEHLPTQPPATTVAASARAYVIYTSGSTGKPKGMLVSHANVVRLMQQTEHWFGFKATDVCSLFHSVAFDFSVWEIWSALLYGGRLEIVPFLVSRSPEDFYQFIQDKKITILNQTPSAFYGLIPIMQTQAELPKWQLRCVIFGGEALTFARLAPWVERCGDAHPQLINMYGITETTVHVTYRRIYKPDVMALTSSVIGQPIPDLALYVIDENCHLQPIGVPGELCIGGPSVAAGYLNRADLITARFIENPFPNQIHQQL